METLSVRSRRVARVTKLFEELGAFAVFAAALDATPLLSWSVIAPLIGAGLVSGIVIAATSLNALAGLLLPFVIAAVILGVTLRQAPQRVAPS